MYIAGLAVGAHNKTSDTGGTHAARSQHWQAIHLEYCVGYIVGGVDYTQYPGVQTLRVTPRFLPSDARQWSVRTCRAHAERKSPCMNVSPPR